MKGKCIQWIFSICFLIQLSGCIGEEKYADDPEGNFRQLWKIIDEQYCFFEYKNVDWKAIGNQTAKKIKPQMDEQQLFAVLSEMLSYLQDGHVNLSSSFDQSGYDVTTSSLRNFDENILVDNRYLGRSYRTLSGIKYKILNDNIGYIYYESFQNPLDETDLNDILSYFSACNGLIIDIRQNGGGNATNSARIASRFVEKKTLTGYIQHKTGSGHNDFSTPYPIYLIPAGGVRWTKPVAVLTNRHSYSAANDFVNHMKGLPNVTIIGDTTGGGGGMPFTSELPNGWTIRFSASPHFDDKMNHIEWGIEPDHKVNMDSKDTNKNIDTIIEAARKRLLLER